MIKTKAHTSDTAAALVLVLQQSGATITAFELSPTPTSCKCTVMAVNKDVDPLTYYCGMHEDLQDSRIPLSIQSLQS